MQPEFFSSAIIIAGTYPFVIGSFAQTLAALHKRNVGDTLSVACSVFQESGIQ